jgi:uncharacterized protein YraI
MKIKSLSLAGGLLLLSVGAATAAPGVVSNDLNLRSGPGTGYRVLDVLPAGSTVDVLGCGGDWCRVSSAEGTGYASSSYLGMGARAYAEALPPVYAAPRPLFRFGLGWGDDWDGGWRPDWDRGWPGGWGDRGDDDD